MAALDKRTGETVWATEPRSKMLRMVQEGKRWQVKELYTTRLDPSHYATVLVGGMIWGGWYRGRTGWLGIDPAAGQIRIRSKDLRCGPVLYADGRLYCQGEDGEVALVEASEEGFEIRGRFRVIEKRKRDVWAHPVIHRRRLYLRYHDTLRCYDIAAR
ncbi:MAG: hypothetical protein ACODAJ_00950 [Planctomycetota bacterium]